jgi:hypothetical protein
MGIWSHLLGAVPGTTVEAVDEAQASTRLDFLTRLPPDVAAELRQLGARAAS